MNEIKATLVYLKNEDKIMLAKKKKGFAAGKYNGVGGKVENNESIKECAIRETTEEIKVNIKEFECVAINKYDEYYKGVYTYLTTYVYFATKWEGTITETEEEGDFAWFKINELPYDKMISDDIYWLPKVVEGKKIKSYFKFDQDFNIIDMKINEVNIL